MRLVQGQLQMKKSCVPDMDDSPEQSDFRELQGHFLPPYSNAVRKILKQNGDVGQEILDNQLIASEATPPQDADAALIHFLIDEGGREWKQSYSSHVTIAKLSLLEEILCSILSTPTKVKKRKGGSNGVGNVRNAIVETQTGGAHVVLVLRRRDGPDDDVTDHTKILAKTDEFMPQTPLVLLAGENESGQFHTQTAITNTNHNLFSDLMLERNLRRTLNLDELQVKIAIGEEDSYEKRKSSDHKILNLLTIHKNLVLEGVPGTGKTHSIDLIEKEWYSLTGRKLAKPKVLTMHPSTTYEDFISGIRPVIPKDGEPPFQYVDGFFKKAVHEAIDNPKMDFLIVLDEFNRANIPKVLGDLLTTIEPSKRAQNIDDVWQPKISVTLVSSSGDEAFFVPDNIYLLCTMNSNDRSVAPLDSALRRRFVFHRIEPLQGDRLTGLLVNQFSTLSEDSVEKMVKFWNHLNHWLRSNLGPDAMLGHSYLFSICETSYSEKDMVSRWHEIVSPQLIDVMQSYDGMNHIDELNAHMQDCPLIEHKMILKAVGKSLNETLYVNFTRNSNPMAQDIGDKTQQEIAIDIVSRAVQKDGYVTRKNVSNYFGGETENPEVNEPWHKIEDIQEKTQHMGENRIIKAWAIEEENGRVIRIFATFHWLNMHLEEREIQEIEENGGSQNPNPGEIIFETYRDPVAVKKYTAD